MLQFWGSIDILTRLATIGDAYAASNGSIHPFAPVLLYLSPPVLPICRVVCTAGWQTGFSDVSFMSCSNRWVHLIFFDQLLHLMTLFSTQIRIYIHIFSRFLLCYILLASLSFAFLPKHFLLFVCVSASSSCPSYRFFQLFSS